MGILDKIFGVNKEVRDKEIDTPIKCEINKVVRFATDDEVKDHFESMGGEINSKEEIKTIRKSMIILRYSHENSFVNDLRCPIYTIKLNLNKSKEYDSTFETLKNAMIHSYIQRYGEEKVSSFVYKEGEVVCKDKKSLNKWKITGHLSDEIIDYKYKHIEYKWFRTTTEDEIGIIYNNLYLIRTIHKPVEYHALYINSEEDLRIEDIFEDLGF